MKQAYFFTPTNKLIEATPKSHMGVLAVSVNEQETMGFVDCIVLYSHKLFKVDIGCKIFIDLLELLQISSLITLGRQLQDCIR